MNQFNQKYDREISIYQKKFEKYEEMKRLNEMEDVTFKPKISKKAFKRKINKSLTDKNMSTYQRYSLF